MACQLGQELSQLCTAQAFPVHTNTLEPDTSGKTRPGPRRLDIPSGDLSLPGRALDAPFFFEVIVSPTRASATVLMEAAKYPTSPAMRRSTYSSPKCDYDRLPLLRVLQTDATVQYSTLQCYVSQPGLRALDSRD